MQSLLKNWVRPVLSNIWSDWEQPDVEQLKKEGTVTESEVEENGFLTKTIKFVSADGTVRKMYSTSSPVIDEKTKRKQELRREMNQVLLEQNYERAAEIRDELKQID